MPKVQDSLLGYKEEKRAEMKKTTYIIIAIAIVFLVILGYVMFLFYSKSGDAAGDGNENGGTINACVELGCEENDVYVGSVNSDKYYECDCRYAKNINPENIVCFKNDAEALSDNRTKSEC